MKARFYINMELEAQHFYFPTRLLLDQILRRYCETDTPKTEYQESGSKTMPQNHLEGL